MNENVILQPAAERDLDEAAEQLARRDVALAIRFSRSVADTLDRIAEMPAIGSLQEFANPKLEGIRVRPVRRFKNYLIFYRPVQDGIVVLRVLHAARDAPTILGQQ